MGLGWNGGATVYNYGLFPGYSPPNSNPMDGKKTWQVLSYWLAQQKAILSILAVTIAVSGGIIGIRSLGLLEKAELFAYDYFMRSRPLEPVDPDVVVVQITEDDIQKQQTWPLSDGVIAKAIANLEEYQPTIIGLDVYRDLPVEPGHKQLQQVLTTHPNFIAVCKFDNRNGSGVQPPSYLQLEQVGFADILVDRGGIVRRALLLVEPSPTDNCPTPLAFSFQLAMGYLQNLGIEPTNNDKNQLQMGEAVFPPLDGSSGGYHQLEHQGYQLLLNYYDPEQTEPHLTLTRVLNKDFRPEWIKDKIVLIGVTAPSIDDAFYSPFSAGEGTTHKIPGVVMHSHIVNQIIDAALGRRNLLWYWPDGLENFWIAVWTTIAVVITVKLRHPLYLPLVIAATSGTLMGVCWLLFLQGGWIPLVPGLIGVLGGSSVILIYQNHRQQQEQLAIAAEVKKQQATIESLKTFWKEQVAAEEEQSIYNETTSLLPPNRSLPLPPSLSLPNDLTTPYPADQTTQLDSEQFSDEPTNAIEDPPTIMVGNHYQINRILGSGGFGYTYLAQDIYLPNKPLRVVKQLQPARKDEAFLNIARRLFTSEAEILDRLGNHPQLPKLYAHFEENSQFYLVEDFIEGTLLTQELYPKLKLPVLDTLKVIEEILEILVYIHSNQVIHRDIKPSNIIREKQTNRLVLIDFGAVKEMHPRPMGQQVNLTVAIGTRGYAAPEQLSGNPGFYSDIYAVGMIGIYCLTGIDPKKLIKDANTSEVLWRELAEVNDAVAKFINKMIAYYFHDRFQTAEEAIKALKLVKATI
jgi:CHASE2 domain-containing sensor protein